MTVYFIAADSRRPEKLVVSIKQHEIPTILDCIEWTVAAILKFNGETAQIIVDGDMNYEKPNNQLASIFVEKANDAPWDVRGDALILTGADMLP